jgi:hypothetical protein
MGKSSTIVDHVMEDGILRRVGTVNIKKIQKKKSTVWRSQVLRELIVCRFCVEHGKHRNNCLVCKHAKLAEVGKLGVVPVLEAKIDGLGAKPNLVDLG